MKLFCLLAATIRILAIGNSFSQDAIEQNLHEIAAADGQEMIIGNMYIGGCSIDTHVWCMENDAPNYAYRKIGLDGVRHETPGFRLSEAMKDEPWDYVSVQQASGYSGLYDSYAKLGQLVAWIHENAPQAKVIFHQTWAYAKNSDHKHFAFYDNDQQKMYDGIIDASTRACRDCGITTIVHCGPAIQAARHSALEDDLELTRDGYHLNLTLGRYIAACVWYEALTGKSVMHNGYVPAGMTKQQLRLARKAAHSVRRM